MSKQDNVITKTGMERRKRWSDRRAMTERRNEARLRRMDGECRNGLPRREADITGKLIEGEMWWSGDRKFV